MFVIRPSSGSFLLNLNLTSTVAQTLGQSPVAKKRKKYGSQRRGHPRSKQLARKKAIEITYV
jgi:hypothetical protein